MNRGWITGGEGSRHDDLIKGVGEGKREEKKNLFTNHPSGCLPFFELKGPDLVLDPRHGERGQVMGRWWWTPKKGKEREGKSEERWTRGASPLDPPTENTMLRKG
ncbi:hypothetical protein IE53DRAFT_162511 [Violaceomyces palustris]|uniref:Uncharacterized protein n=1 Tax=Violaceomyces palustris TaxID=1673888 RepID=A0ACD0NTI5_9BASI|nr:hypothetical protein IE53DRAFT_162511 [Violaceomyces palustris]